MLLFSYIISAAMESAIAYIQYAGNGDSLLIYALLAGSSLLSIAVEFSEQGETVRKEMKAAGRNVEQYDMISNLVRTGIYAAVLFGVLNASTGAMMACGCIMVSMVMAMFAM